MYPNAQAQTYQRTPQTGDPRMTEGWALIEAARRMAETIQNTEGSEVARRNRMREALRLNWQLWTIFQAELTAAESPVPEELRVSMLTLCQFVDKHTVASLTDPTPERLVVLIDINRNIAAGLLQVDPGAERDTQAAAPQETPPQRMPLSISV